MEDHTCECGVKIRAGRLRRAGEDGSIYFGRDLRVLMGALYCFDRGSMACGDL